LTGTVLIYTQAFYLKVFCVYFLATPPLRASISGEGVVKWETIRIEIFGTSIVRKADSYPMRTGHVMFVKVYDDYGWFYNCGW
jgi:hypothetical protein